MARMGLTPLSIDITDYARLPSDVRVRFDAWLKAETLSDKMIVELTLAEGEVVVTRVAEPPRLDPDGETVKYVTRYPVRSLPPREVFG